MFKQFDKWVLATSSPRRIELFKKFNFNFTSQPADVDESANNDELPNNYSLRIAQKKALAVSSKVPQAKVVVAADTIIDFEDKIIGKPESRQKAFNILNRLNGKKHFVHTGVFVLIKGKNPLSFVGTTKVSFFNHHTDLINNYLDTNESMDKSGAYSIEGFGGILVEHIQGSFNNVVGFPIEEFIQKCLNTKLLKLV